MTRERALEGMRGIEILYEDRRPLPPPPSARRSVDLHVTPRQFAVLRDWLSATWDGDEVTIKRAWLREIGLEPADFEMREANIIVDWWRTK